MISGVNSPAAISSPSCEIKNELLFPSLPSQPSSQPMSLQDQAKVAPKVSQLSQLDAQLSKLHQRPVLSQQAVNQAATFSEAVRMSPTTVQPAAVSIAAPTNVVQQQLAVSNPPATSTQARRPSRFMVSKVIEEAPKTQQPQQVAQNIPTQNIINQNQIINPIPIQPQPQTIPKSTVTSPDTEQQIQQQRNQQQVLPPVQDPVVTSQQAQNFFIQHQGGLVSLFFCMRHRLFIILYLFFVFWIFMIFMLSKNPISSQLF